MRTSRRAGPPVDGGAVVCSALARPPMHASAPPAFHPPSSLLGRAVRRRAADARQAEGLYAVAAALAVVAAALLTQWGWMLPETDPLTVGAATVAGWVLVSAACFIGWRPRLHVHVDGASLRVRRGRESFVLPLGAIASAERVPAAVFHRHWRRYAATRAFVNRLGDEVLLLRTEHGPVVLGLADGDLTRLEERIARHEEPAPLVRAA